MSGLKSRNKGLRSERKVVRVLQDAGIAGERVPLSGAAGGSFKGDISMPLLGRDVTLEVKSRATGFKQIYNWMAGNYGVVVMADRHPPIICLPLADFAEVARLSDELRSIGLAAGVNDNANAWIRLDEAAASAMNEWGKE